jgi:hypothetical protein
MKKAKIKKFLKNEILIEIIKQDDVIPIKKLYNKLIIKSFKRLN